MDEGDYSKKDLEVHHIVKLKDDPSGFLENENLISLCVKHHKMADEGELSVEYLTSLALEREEGIESWIAATFDGKAKKDMSDADIAKIEKYLEGLVRDQKELHGNG